ncbi:hypothetical protein NHX12_013554 [Muraenolepis orangiensis]|uniref:Ankyrin repeat and sterile alpha motif domain containing 1A n=1 Tax=Muraenolepis orangiensis TaxID=630683 RepID=A0A9Q0DHM8_9TELE|nr:hypothetical protein NHX12_013554 [Muraenolepis orangiensis]
MCTKCPHSSRTLLLLCPHSIWRGPNVNCVDSTGYTPLHHAALNGHSEVVEALLRNEALTNVADNKGCYPLHLAAWKGDQRIVRLLIHQGPSHPKLNEQSSVDPKESKRCGPFDPYINAKKKAGSLQLCPRSVSVHRWKGLTALPRNLTCFVMVVCSVLTLEREMSNNDNETPLHCAAQYGHTQVARLLLEELTDPTMRNNKFETPLDLAALYGRLDVVKLLLGAHPNLLGCNTRRHTPLHLASRNGHLGVVEVLLGAGMDINYETEKGSALHEAALFGKADVVQKLLSAGIEVNIVDFKGLTALDTVQTMPSQKSREIASLIHCHMAGKPPDMDLPPPPVPPPQESPSPRRKGDLDKMTELISGMAPGPEEESPYEALFEATSCHSLDSLASGKSSDRDSGRPDSDAGKKERLAHPSHPVPGHEEDVSSEASEDQPGVAVPEQFTGLLHGSSPVFDCREEPFRLPGPPPAGQPQPDAKEPEAKAPAKAPAPATSAPATAPAVAPPPPRPNMAGIHTDCDPKAIYATVIKEPRDGGATPPLGGRMRPPGDLKLARSLSKSDSDLLVSPPGEEEGCLGNRSESVSNCSAGKKRLEKSPSFTSEWDEVRESRRPSSHT